MSTRQEILDAIRGKIGQFPIGPGVYLFKDAAGVVIYIGKAKSLRSRVASYFQPAANLLASRGPDIARMVADLVTDVEYLECDSEVDALLHESRLIKDTQPRFNAMQKDDKSFPYLQITTGEDFPRVSVTRQPRHKGVKLYGPFVSPADLRAALPLMQRVFKFCTCHLDFDDSPDRKRYRPCILHSIKQCSAPCAAMISREDYLRRIKDFMQFMDSKAAPLRRKLTAEMQAAAERLDFEQAANIRDELRAMEGLQERGLASDHMQPEVFYVDQAAGLARLGEVLHLATPPRTIEGIDIAHLDGQEMCGAMVCFIDARPFKNSYRRYRIKTVAGNDDYACIREVVWRRYKYAGMEAELFPDIILIDGGRGQLNAALSAFEDMAFTPPMMVALAKKEETLFVLGRDEPLKLSRHDPALQLLQAVRDEAHRFVQVYHHILRRKKTLEEDSPQSPQRTRRKKE
ncbi:MAG: excinuclease ABC subunit UvrC [Planctomycetaceae bacterium]|nr:excinuclease ABC subunit UvrC [Planctomycetaceae bacterium]